MAVDCCDNSGGRVELKIDGKLYRARGSFTIRPTAFSREAGSNSDGSIYVTTKAEPAETEFTLSDRCGLNIGDLTKGCHIDATIRIIDMKKTWLFSMASVVGRPEYDTESGEIRGLKLVSGNVRVV